MATWDDEDDSYEEDTGYYEETGYTDDTDAPYYDPYGEESGIYDTFRETTEAVTGVSYPFSTSITDQRLHDRLMAKLDARADQIEQVTGEKGDVKRDPEMWTGRSTLMFKDVMFAVRNEPKGLKKWFAGDEPVEEKVILEKTSGVCRPGELIALMGPSGCGKSTLLDMLADKKTADYDGDILFNGHERDPTMFSRVTSYVPQEDVMWTHATVRETIEFVENLAGPFPKNVDHGIRERRIESILEILGLSKVADTKIGDATVRGISGGQKRRVTLAKSMISFAEIIFADEPTSGLSATDAEICVKAMRHHAHSVGKIYIVVIHQPRIEVVKLFDRLMLLTAQPGRLVYNGSFKAAEKFFEQSGFPVPEHANPADHFLDVITPGAKGAEPDRFVQLYNQNQRPKFLSQVDALIQKAQAEGWPDEFGVLEANRTQIMDRGFGDIPETRESSTATGFCTQLVACAHRRIVLLFRDKGGLVKTYFLSVFKAVLLGIGLWDVASEAASLQLGAFYLVTLMVAMSSMIDMPRLIDERYIMKTEVFSSLYSHIAFIVPFILLNAIINFTANALFIIIFYLFAGFSPQLFPVFFGWVTLCWLAFDSLFSMVAALAPTSAAASGLAVLFNLVLVMYNGFTITRQFAPGVVRWIIYISPAFYVIQGLAINGQEWSKAGSLPCKGCRGDWDNLVATYEFSDGDKILGVCLLLWYAFIFRVGQIFFLTTLHNPVK